MGCRKAIFVDKSTFDFPIFLLFFNAKFPIFPIFSILSFLFSYFFGATMPLDTLTSSNLRWDSARNERKSGQRFDNANVGFPTKRYKALRWFCHMKIPLRRGFESANQRKNKSVFDQVTVNFIQADRVALSTIGSYQKGPCVNYDYTIFKN